MSLLSDLGTKIGVLLKGYDDRITFLEENGFNLLGSELNPAPNAKAIIDAGHSQGDGLYWFQNSNINSGNKFQAYCDMTTSGGGWILLVQNSSVNGATKMNYTNYSLHNQSTPPSNPTRSSADISYSILAWADYLKSSDSGFQYMIDAYERGRYGGIWTANTNYSFNSTSNSNTNITLNTQFDSWSYQDDGIEARMPWVAAGVQSGGMLTTSTSATSSWWGTIIEASSSFTPAPWISSSAVAGSAGITDNPGVIWYWVR